MSDFDLAKHRAAEAQHLIENPLLVAALEKIEARYLEAWKKTKSGDAEKREQLWNRLTGLLDLKTELTKDITAGKIAADVLKRQQIGGPNVQSRGSHDQPSAQPFGGTLADQYR